MNTKGIQYAELRRFLLGLGLGYKEATTDSARVFHRKGKDMVLFRLYRDDEEVSERDLFYARRYLDWSGLLDAEIFDAFLNRATTSA
jgi:hypothetical protein